MNIPGIHFFLIFLICNRIINQHSFVSRLIFFTIHNQQGGSGGGRRWKGDIDVQTGVVELSAVTDSWLEEEHNVLRGCSEASVGVAIWIQNVKAPLVFYGPIDCAQSVGLALCAGARSLSPQGGGRSLTSLACGSPRINGRRRSGSGSGGSKSVPSELAL